MENATTSVLKGRKALISGGHSGIGLAIAGKLAAAGVYTAVADIRPAPVLPDLVASFSCDITQAPQIANLYAQVRQAFGHPDILISNAGLGIHEKLTEGDPAKWQQVIEVNLMGALRLVRAFVPDMVAAGFGDVVFISSVAAGQAYPYGGVYAATKTALQLIAETLRLEVLPAVRVTTIAPGVTNTNFFAHALSGCQTPESIGYGALAAETVADAVLYALSQPRQVAANQLTIRPVNQPF